MRHVLKVASVVSMALWMTACGSEAEKAKSNQAAPAMEVSVLEVKSAPQALQVQLPGRSVAFLEAEVRPQVNGIILKRSFTEGGDVKQGESLYQIDPSTYKASLQSARADLARAEAALASAKATQARYQELVKTKYISKEEYDKADASYKEALAVVEVAKAAINTATINVNYTEVQAPIAGRIGKSSVTAGALVTANQAQPLATIQQLDPINVDIVQSSTQMLRLKSMLKAGKLQASDDAEVTLLLEDGSTYDHKGRLQFAEVSVDQSTGSVTLRAEFPNPDHTLLPGMYVRAILNTGVDPQAILVPQKAISRNPKGEAVAMLVGAENKVEARVIKTADVINHQWRVTDGLKPGDKLIVEGLQKIRPGMPVTAKPMTANQ
ncbi:efflux RND transporter periplasmic adaptor subunit [Shewanella algae]|uniref:efflux RND transporter periplasmic adaptor subunit n=1 Tax=Shewanella algae TaxID=38313 RepID=UPI001F31418F|nr:efflux RND transporter periplasmic adaptor subunit [Shewanella algae]MCE9785773.1 efflux RND transporter periplasmic adaptor subunit [Shewanella algae]